MVLFVRLALMLFLVAPETGLAQYDFDSDGVSIVDDEGEYRPKKKKRKRKKRRRVRVRDEDIEAAFEVWKKPYQRKKKKSLSETSFSDEEDVINAKSEEFDWERSPRGSEFLSEGVPQFTSGEWAGEIALEARAYEKFTATSDLVDKNFGILLRLERTFESESNAWEAKTKAFARFDALDSDRNSVFPEDIWISYAKDLFQIRVGFQIFNWSQMDIFNPADLINSVNFDSEIESLEKLGELALTLKMNLAIGFLEFIYMPIVLPPNFPGPNSRLSLLDPGEAMGDAIFVKKNGDLVERTTFNQFAVRWSRSFWDADVNIFFIDQVDRRNPEIVFQSGSSQFRPVFFPIATFGANALYSSGGNTYKLEMLRRLVSNPTQPTIFGTLKKVSHSIGAAGYEREFEVWGGKSLTTFLEYTWVFGLDDGATLSDKLRIGSFQNDLAVGARLNFNDPNAQEIRALVDVDFDRKNEILASATYSRRIGENWKAALSYRYIKATQQDTVAVGLEKFDGDSFVELKLTRFF